MKPKHVEIHLLVGNKDARTEFAFRHALTNAPHGYVIFITKKLMGPLPDNLDSSIPTDKRIFRTITFAYPLNWPQMLNKCCLLHTWRKTAQTIVVHGLETYFYNMKPESHVSRAALLCAALLDAAGSCARVTGKLTKLAVDIDREYYDRHESVVSTLINTYFNGNVEILQ